MMRIRVNMFPAGGYRFKESDGTLIVGDSWRGVTARVIAYRKRAGLPKGDPAKDVNDQHCQTNPGGCFRADDGTNAAAIKVASLKSRVLQWFSRLRESAKYEPLLIGDQTNATNRANICAGCPQAQSLPEGCSSCKAAVRELRNEVIGGRPTDGRLVHRGCNAIGADLATQVWLDQITVNDNALPAHCWRKRG